MEEKAPGRSARPEDTPPVERFIPGAPGPSQDEPSSTGKYPRADERRAFALDLGTSGQLFVHLAVSRDARGRAIGVRAVGMNLVAHEMLRALGRPAPASAESSAPSAWPELLAELSEIRDARPRHFELTEPWTGRRFSVVGQAVGNDDTLVLLSAHDLDPARDGQDDLAAVRLALTQVFERMPVGVVRWEPVLDFQGRLVDLIATLNNRAAARLMGRLGEDLHGRSMRRDFPRIERAGRWEPHVRVWETGEQYFVEAGGEVDGLGDRRRLVTVVRLPDALLSTVFDVHDRWLAEQAVVVAEARARALVLGSPIPVMVLDAQLTCVQVNDAAQTLFGLERAQMTGLPFQSLVRPAGPHEVEDVLGALVRGEVDVLERERLIRRADGTRRWVRIVMSAVHDPAGETAWFIAHLLDVTKERADVARLRHDATHDPLTGLPNRVLLEERLRHAQERRPREDDGQPPTARRHVAVIFIDLDGLKAINDQHGHGAGDQLLIETARRLATATRAHDTVARLGGDEFVVLLEEVTLQDVAAVTGRVADTLAEPTVLAKGRLAEGASIGVAVALPGEPPQAVLERADEAMYADKRRRKASAGRGPRHGQEPRSSSFGA